MAKSLDGSEDYISSSDVIERLDELKGFLFDENNNLDPEADEVDVDEYNQLNSFKEEGEEFSDWDSGMTFISEHVFTEYARDSFEETNGTGVDTGDWPFRHIDWDEAADELKQDYNEVEFDGTTYYGLA